LDTATDEYWIQASLCFDSEQEAKEYILGFGNQIKIISPTKLKEEIIKMARNVLDMYQ